MDDRAKADCVMRNDPWGAESVRKMCGAQFELAAGKLVDFLFDAAASLPGSDDMRTAPFLELPIVGGVRFYAGNEPFCLRQRVFNALTARELFRKTRPAWAPDLPIRHEDIDKLQDSRDNRMRLVGYFADSQLSAVWDPGHPRFHHFGCGLMAHKLAPARIRNDAGLRREFPPCRIEGFCDQELIWRSPEAWAAHRQNAENIAAHEARKAAGPGPLTG